MKILLWLIAAILLSGVGLGLFAQAFGLDDPPAIVFLNHP